MDSVHREIGRAGLGNEYLDGCRVMRMGSLVGLRLVANSDF